MFTHHPHIDDRFAKGKEKGDRLHTIANLSPDYYPGGRRSFDSSMNRDTDQDRHSDVININRLAHGSEFDTDYVGGRGFPATRAPVPYEVIRRPFTPIADLTHRTTPPPGHVYRTAFGPMRSQIDDNTWVNYGRHGYNLKQDAWWAPRVDVLEEDNGKNVRVEVELPGVKKEDINLTVGEDFVNVQARKRMNRQEDQALIYQNERHFGQFFRRIVLPEHVDTAHCRAVMDTGVLKVIFPVVESSTGGTRHRIPIIEAPSTSGYGEKTAAAFTKANADHSVQTY